MILPLEPFLFLDRIRKFLLGLLFQQPLLLEAEVLNSLAVSDLVYQVAAIRNNAVEITIRRVSLVIVIMIMFV